MKKAVSGIILALIMFNMLTLVFNVHPVKAEWTGTVYIRADGSIDPPDAPITSLDNITYTFTDNIYDSIVVERDNIVVDGVGYTVEGTGVWDSKGIDVTGRSNVTIKNLEIRKFCYGIWLSESSDANIQGNNVTANSEGGILLLRSSNNGVQGNNVTDNGHGIILRDSSNYNSISGNNINTTYVGIYVVYYSSNNSICGNNIANNDYGIKLDSSSNNSICGNNITANNDYGIYLLYSFNNTIVRNTFTDDGLVVRGSYQNVVEDNTVNGKLLVYLENTSHQKVGEAGQVILVNCEHITVENLNLSHTSVGLQLWNTNKTIISRNSITNNDEGIWLKKSSSNVISENSITNNGPYGNGVDLWFSFNNTISGNSITANNQNGIMFYGSSNNTIFGNDIADNVLGIRLWYSSDYNNIFGNNIMNTSLGIDLYCSSNNMISGNNIANNLYGIELDSSSNNSICGNNIANNFDGIKLDSSSNNSISRNDISDNGYGIYLEGVYLYTIISGNSIADNEYGVQLYYTTSITICRNNITNNEYGVYLDEYALNINIYHNNFINNTEQGYVSTTSYSNNLDNGYPSGGNYWSDYTGVDLHSGSDQDETGSDGIGDAAHEIDADNRDRYPLMAPFTTFDAGTWNETAYNVDVVSNSTVSNFHFNPEEGPFLRFNVSGDDGTAGFCRVTIPKNLLWVEDCWTITVGNQTITDYNVQEDGNHTYIYFSYQHSTQTVTIQGTHVIPEIPTALILPLFMIFSAIALVLAKKKRLKKQKPKPLFYFLTFQKGFPVLQLTGIEVSSMF